MRSKRWLDNHFLRDSSLKKMELLILSKTLRSSSALSLDIENLVADHKRASTVAPFNNSGIGLNLWCLIFVLESELLIELC